MPKMKRVIPSRIIFFLILIIGVTTCGGKNDEIVVPSGENSRFFTTKMRGFNIIERSEVYTESDIQTLYDWGVNSARYLITGYRFIDRNKPHEFIRKDFERLDQILEWCEKYNIYFIIT